MGRQSGYRFRLASMLVAIALTAFAFAGFRFGVMYGVPEVQSKPIPASERLELARDLLTTILESRNVDGSVSEDGDGGLVVAIHDHRHVSREALSQQCDLSPYDLFADLRVALRFPQ